MVFSICRSRASTELAVPTGGLRTSWWAAGERYVRWPWLYLLGAHLVVALVAAVPTGHLAYLLLGLLALSAAAFVAAQAWRRTLPDEAAVWRAGQPDRYLLHLSYGGLLGSLVLHSCLVVTAETLFGVRAAYLTAGLFCGVVAALAGTLQGGERAWGSDPRIRARTVQWLHSQFPKRSVFV